MSKETVAHAAIAQLRGQSLTALVRDELERLILTGEAKAGERLNEAALAARLGVSRGPVREAARALERDGLVTSVVNQGFFVRQLSAEDAAELYELRAMLVGYVCGKLAGEATEALKDELNDLIARMQAAADAGDADAYYEINLTFHDRIMEMAGRRRAAELYRSLVKEAHLFRRRSLMSPAAMQASNAEHRRIIDAIAAGDAAAARAAAEEHHLNGKRRWLDTLR
jgi:DNA-binding GntR family transcriptional regulator